MLSFLAGIVLVNLVCASCVSNLVWLTCYVLSYYRLLPAGLREVQAAGIKYSHRSKIRFSPRRGDLLHRFT